MPPVTPTNDDAISVEKRIKPISSGDVVRGIGQTYIILEIAIPLCILGFRAVYHQAYGENL